MAFILSLRQGTSNQAEASALLYRLKWCIQKGYNLVIGETDSLLLQNCIKNIWHTPWRIEKVVKEIRSLIGNNRIITIYCFREANQVADKLASLSHTAEDVCIYNQFNTPPRQIKGLVNTDQMEIAIHSSQEKKAWCTHFRTTLKYQLYCHFAWIYEFFCSINSLAGPNQKYTQKGQVQPSFFKYNSLTSGNKIVTRLFCF